MATYLERIQSIHDSYDALFTAAINTADCRAADDPPRDLLIVNGSIVLESDLLSSWQKGRVIATGRPENLEAAVGYLQGLRHCMKPDSALQFQMSDERVKNLFGAQLDEYSIDRSEPNLAERLTHELVRDDGF